MKIPTPFRPRRGFTLIELLVVIAIIMVLAATGFSVGGAMLNRAKKLSAQTMATAVDQAVNAFYSEYGGFPTNGDASEITTGPGAGAEFLNALLGNDEDLNPRGMSFLSVKEGRGQAASGIDGLVYDSEGEALGLYDPWGNPFTIVMDIAFDDKIEFTPTGIQGASQIRLNRRRIAVYSPGVPDGETATIKTMIKSW